MDDRTERDELLQVYVGDHLAGSVAGTRLARRLADAERDSPDGPALVTLADAIDEDRRELVALAAALGIDAGTYKQVVAWLGERVGRLKLNGSLLRRSPLSTVLEMEALLAGVRGKLAGWETLRSMLGARPVEAIDLDRLIARASTQLETLSELHGAAATRVLGAANRS